MNKRIEIITHWLKSGVSKLISKILIFIELTITKRVLVYLSKEKKLPGTNEEIKLEEEAK